eukprot:scaffold16951_cov48-Attheya_sp.AAC.3
MGGSNSKAKETAKNGHDFLDRVKSNVNDEVARRMMIQREIQMAVKIAQARDTLCVFGSAWAVFTAGVTLAHLRGRSPKPPTAAAIPIVIGGLVLGNMADMAYGNKMARVVKEAEYMLDHERERFVPMKQAAFAKFYTEEEKERMYYPATPVGDMYPNRLIFPHLVPTPATGPPSKNQQAMANKEN